MTVREKTRQYRMAEWAAQLGERKRSGQSVDAWCKEHGISKHRYYYWQRKLRELVGELPAAQNNSSEKPVPTGFVAIETIVAAEPPTATTATSTGLTIEVGGCRIAVDSGTDIDLLAKVCKALVTA